MQRHFYPTRSRPKGFTLIEAAAAMAMLSACLVVFAQLVAFVASQRVAEKKRQAAVDQVQNTLEQLAEISDEKLIALDFDKSGFEQTTKRAVPEGKIEFSCEPMDVKNGAREKTKSFIFRTTVSWEQGKARPRGDVSMFRLLTLTDKGEPAP